MRLASVLFALFLPLVAAAATVEWQTDPDAAVALAQRDGRMLLVYYRLTTNGPSNAAERAIAQMSADEVFVHSLDAFVPLRVDHRTDSQKWLKTPREPLLALYDASGTPLAEFWKVRSGWKAVAEDVLRFRGVRELVAQSAALRLADNATAADFLLGYVMRETRRLEESMNVFLRAAEGFARNGDTVSEQLARLGAAGSQFAYGQKPQARAELNKILANAASQDVEAEATLLLASIFEANARTPVSSVPRGKMLPPVARSPVALSPAIKLYRDAYVLAASGSTTEASARSALERLDNAPLPSKGDANASLRIIPPPRTTFTGHSQFLIEAPPATARVDVFLDEEKVATRTRKPFRVAFDVGSTPRLRVVKARAFDSSGALLGETTLPINDRLDNFYVTIVNPATRTIRGRTPVQVDVKAPPERSVSSVAILWNGEPVATLTRPPYESIVAAQEPTLSYLEAVATLDDGTTASATRVYNGELGETVDVAAVTVLATVTGADGNPQRGLTAADFVIEDEGTRVKHDLLSDDDDPVTIGIAIDSSSSMQGRQLYALRAATRFLERALRTNDQAFVVAFDTRARLVHERSSDLDSLRASILDLMPAGGTSIFDAATFALQQFQGIPGRKALIVVSDGREGTSSASAREAERLARTVGVPIYLFVPPGGGGRLGHALSQLSDLTGGTLYHSIAEKDFDTTYDRLAAELRAQYVLQFRRPSGVASGEWRTIRVTAPPGANVRTIAGYRAN